MQARRPRFPVPPPFLLVLLALPAVGVSCAGPNCQSSCDKLFQSDQCALEHPGISLETQRENCVTACAGALANPGDIGDYNPNERTSGSRSVDLENDQQAAAWMECVEATSCEYLDDGYCSPVSF